MKSAFVLLFLLAAQWDVSHAQTAKRDLNENILIIVEAKIKAGKYDEFVRTAQEMSDVVSKGETGALTYEWTISRDSSTCFIIERYASSAAALNHSKIFREQLAVKFNAVLEFAGMTVYGNPNEELRKAFGAAAENHRVKVAGFSR